MILDTATRSARIVLGEAVTATAPTVCAFWADQTSGTGGFLPGDSNTTTNGTTPVTIVAAPGVGVQRAVTEIRCYNADTVTHNVTLQLDDNGTIYVIETVSVAAGFTYSYVPGQPSNSGTGSSAASVLVESGGSQKISAMGAPTALNGTEKTAGVQSGANVAITGSNLGLLILSNAFTTYPLDATVVTGGGTPASIRGGNGGATSGNGGAITLTGGNATSGNAGSVILQPGTTKGGGTNGHVLVNTVTDDGIDMLQVNGSAMASSFVTNGASGPTWTGGASAPASTQPAGSIYSRTGGANGSLAYLSAGGGTWFAIGSGWQEIASYTLSAATQQTIPITGFRRYRLTYQGVQVNTAGAVLGVQASINGGSTFISGAGTYGQMGIYLLSATVQNFQSAGTNVQVSLALTATAGFVADGRFEIYPGTATNVATMQGIVQGNNNASGNYIGLFGGAVSPGAVVNALSFFPSSGTVSGLLIVEGLI